MLYDISKNNNNKNKKTWRKKVDVDIMCDFDNGLYAFAIQVMRGYIIPLQD